MHVVPAKQSDISKAKRYKRDNFFQLARFAFVGATCILQNSSLILYKLHDFYMALFFACVFLLFVSCMQLLNLLTKLYNTFPHRLHIHDIVHDYKVKVTVGTVLYHGIILSGL